MLEKAALHPRPASRRTASSRRGIENGNGTPRALRAVLLGLTLCYTKLLTRLKKGHILVPRKQGQELSELATERITKVVRSLADDRIERGVDLDRPMHCDSCAVEKPSPGSALYGAYKFCNDCLLEFTLALAAGTVDTAADFMTRQSDEPESIAPTDLPSPHERAYVSLNPLPGRDKLMPRNEPC